ncbi:Hypothetical protein A7982_10629 [Minicystis rosea]|nr:Hypothetical protein A7982_10629 [Minicystis rosea]
MPMSRSSSAAAEATTATADDARELWQKRLSRAQHTLTSYREATRYPPGSRPMAEQPDQMTPHHVAAVTLPLARKDGKLTDAKVTLEQDRLFLVGDERVTFSLTCVTSEGPATCEVQRAMAGPSPDVSDAGARAPVPITFAPAESHQAMRALFQPSAQGFQGYHGAIHVALDLVVAGESGGASFEVVYTPAAPATFTGQVRETLEQGSLGLHVEMNVIEPGRYVLAARVDDAEGRSFAYLSFNEELAAGRQEANLTLFGKLIRDQGARAPFRLRDLEGFRLLPDTHPDRELIPALEGTVYTTKTYVLRDFSDAEWESEEKDRHVKELTKDVEEAKRRAESAAR